MGITIYLFYFIGSKADNYYKIEPIGKEVGTLLGVAASMYHLVTQVNKLKK